MTKPREYTTEEIRNVFLDHVHALVWHWNNQQNKTTEDKLNGLAFSILAALDGCACGCPGFIVAPSVHPDDKQYHKDNGENWYPDNNKAAKKIVGDIAGCLHELF